MAKKSKKIQKTGVHEGVAVCLRELSQEPPLPEGELVDSLSALVQFTLADSDDEAAAATLAIPVLARLAGRGPLAVRQRAALTLGEICDELAERGKPPVVDEQAVADLEALLDAGDPEPRRIALSMLASLSLFDAEDEP